MITMKQLKELLNKYKKYRLMVHNGYDGWAYGCPVDPIYLTPKSSIDLLNIISKKKNQDVVKELDKDLHDLVYAEKNEKLYELTNSNRIIGLYDPSWARFINKQPTQQEVELDLSELI